MSSSGHTQSVNQITQQRHYHHFAFEPGNFKGGARGAQVPVTTVITCVHMYRSLAKKGPVSKLISAHPLLLLQFFCKSLEFTPKSAHPIELLQKVILLEC